MDPILRKNFSYLFLLQNINYIIPLLLLPYLTRVLGADNFGKIAFAQAFVAYFSMLTDFGFGTSAMQEIVKVRKDKQALSKIYWTTTFAKSLFAAVSLVIFLLFLLGIPKLGQMYLLLLIAFITVPSTVLFPVWLFQGLEKMSWLTWLSGLPKIGVLIFTFLLVREKSDFTLALLIQVAGTFVTSLLCILLIVKQKMILFYFPSRNDIKVGIIESWHFFASGFATNLYTTTNTVLLGFLSSDAMVGIFSASEKIIRSISNLFYSIYQVTFPRINAYYHESREQALVFAGKVLKVTAISTFLTGIFLLLAAPLIVKILFGVPQYTETIAVMRLSSFLPFFANCNAVLAVNVLFTFGLKRYLTRIVGTAGIFSIVLVVPAIFLFQARGVAVVATLTEILIGILLLYVLRKNKIKIKL
jgi:O-antigen/teichoic acid export membrane protein